MRYYVRMIPIIISRIVTGWTQDSPTQIDIVKKVNDANTFAQAQVERAFLKGIGGDCHTKIAGHATGSNPITLKAMYYD